MKKPNIERIADRVRGRRQGRYSELYRWLRDNHERIGKILAEDRPTWQALADEIGAEGIRGARGQLIAAEDLRKMWQRVCRDVQQHNAAPEPQILRPSRRNLPRGWEPPLADASAGAAKSEGPEPDTWLGLRNKLGKQVLE